MKKLITLIIVASIFLVGCVTTEIDSNNVDSTTPVNNSTSAESKVDNLIIDNSGRSITGIFRLKTDISVEPRVFHIELNSSSDLKNLTGNLILQTIRHERIAFTESTDLFPNTFSYELLSDQNISIGRHNFYLIFIDENKNTKVDQNELGVKIKGFDLENGEEFVFAMLNEDDFAFPQRINPPGFDYDIKDKPLPPDRFALKSITPSLSLVDLEYREPLHFYPSNIESDFILLFGEEPDDITSKPDGGKSLRFNLNDGGFVIISFDAESNLTMFYPRNTERYTLPGFPPLPWSIKDVDEFFGLQPHEYDSDEIHINNDQIPGFRLDLEDSSVTGFRMWLNSIAREQ